MVIKAIILDMDGTLADTGKIGVDVFVNFLNKHKIKYRQEKVMEILYKGHGEVLKDIMAENNIEYSQKLRDELREKYVEEIRKTQLYPHAIELLEAINEKAIMILATLSSSRAVDAILDTNDIKKYFDLIVTADSYDTHLKSEMIQKILDKCSLKPEECMLLEDSHMGIGAGKKNGIFTIGVRHQFEDINADVNVDNLVEAKKIMLKKLKGE